MYEPAPVDRSNQHPKMSPSRWLPIPWPPIPPWPATEDSDGDNYLDALELEVGLDPYNPDVDGDGVADGDEVNIYFTDPWYWDSDGDGISDGEELFGI